MRVWHTTVLIILCVGGLLDFTANAADPIDRQIAGLMADKGASRLSSDSDDVAGRALVRLAHMLDRDNRRANATLQLLKSGKPIPPIASKYSDNELVAMIIGRVDHLQKAPKLSKGRAMLCRYYLLAASGLAPKHKGIQQRLARMDKQGYNQTLQELAGVEAEAKKEAATLGEEPAVASRRSTIKRHFGIGLPESTLVQMHGKVKMRSMIKKPDVYSISMFDGKLWYKALIHNKVCRRISIKIEQKNVRKLLHPGKGREWQEISDKEWISRGGVLIALYEGGALHVWDKSYYDAIHGKPDKPKSDVAEEGDDEPDDTVATENLYIRDFGIGTAHRDLERQYKSTGDRKYITKPSEYIQTLYSNDGYKVDAYIHFGKCRRVVIAAGGSAEEILAIDGRPTDGWEAAGEERWRSKDGKLIAYIRDEVLNVWDVDWYRKVMAEEKD